MCRCYRTMLWSLMTSLKEATGKLRCSGLTTETLTSLSLKDSQHGAESPLPAVTSPCRLTDRDQMNQFHCKDPGATQGSEHWCWLTPTDVSPSVKSTGFPAALYMSSAAYSVLGRASVGVSAPMKVKLRQFILGGRKATFYPI